MQRALYSAARVHALALKFAAEAVSRRGDAGLSLHKKLRDRTAAASCCNPPGSSLETNKPASGETPLPPTRSCGRLAPSSH